LIGRDVDRVEARRFFRVFLDRLDLQLFGPRGQRLGVLSDVGRIDPVGLRGLGRDLQQVGVDVFEETS
jgi:hypothetical protein